MRAEKLNHLGKSHLIVVIGVDLSQEEVNLLLLMNDSHLRYQHFELGLIQDSLFQVIDIFEHGCKVMQEFFMLLQLKVKN